MDGLPVDVPLDPPPDPFDPTWADSEVGVGVSVPAELDEPASSAVDSLPLPVDPWPASVDSWPPSVDSWPPSVELFEAALARRSFLAQPEPLKWTAGAAMALRIGPEPHKGHAAGGSAWTPWITSNRRPQAAHT